MDDLKLPSWLTENEDGSLTVSFKDMKRQPEIDGTKISSLSMREPTAGDELAVEKINSDGEREIQLFANLCEQSPEGIRGLTMRQYNRIADAYRFFLV